MSECADWKLGMQAIARSSRGHGIATQGTAGLGNPRPEPQGQHNLIIVTLDSCRYDSFMAAAPKIITRLTQGKVEKRYSYASWTAPSHYNLLMGLLPHSSPQHVFASEYYKHDFLFYNQRLGTAGIEFSRLVPSLWLPTFLRRTLGYTTHARVSLPVLNPRTPIE